MVQFISRAEAIADPLAAKLKVMTKLRALAELDDAESLVVPILVDAILIAEAYRRARHEITFLPGLTRSVDGLLRALTLIEEQERAQTPDQVSGDIDAELMSRRWDD